MFKPTSFSKYSSHSQVVLPLAVMAWYFPRHLSPGDGRTVDLVFRERRHAPGLQERGHDMVNLSQPGQPTDATNGSWPCYERSDRTLTWSTYQGLELVPPTATLENDTARASRQHVPPLLQLVMICYPFHTKSSKIVAGNWNESIQTRQQCYTSGRSARPSLK